MSGGFLKPRRGEQPPCCAGVQGGSFPPSSSAKSQRFCYHRAGGTSVIQAVHRSGMNGNLARDLRCCAERL